MCTYLTLITKLYLAFITYGICIVHVFKINVKNNAQHLSAKQKTVKAQIQPNISDIQSSNNPATVL